MLYKNQNPNWSLGKTAVLALMLGLASLAVVSCERDVVPSSANGEEMVKGNINVTGIVRGPDGTPQPGALVADANGKRSTTTDKDGRFSLKVPAGTDIKVGYAGFGTMDLKVYPKYRNADYDVVLASKDGKPNSMRLAPSADGQSIKVSVQREEIDGETIYSVVEEIPEFPGGIQAMYNFLGENIKYPEAAKRANVQGKVFLSFTVTKKGDIQDIKVLKGIGFGADEEAMRVVSIMPRWKSGMQSGRAVNVKYNLPIAFQVEGGEKKNGTDKSLGDIAPEILERLKNGSFSMHYDDRSAKNVDFVDKMGLEKATVVIDGVVQKAEYDVKQVNPESIKAIHVLTGEKATQAYGAKGADGVIEITTKK